MKIISIIALSLSFLAIQKEVPKYKGYELVWNDEFAVNGIPNPNNWDYEQGFVRNQEAQWYQKENAYCKDGFLIIEARNEKKSNPVFVSKTNQHWAKQRDSIRVTSSCLITRGKHSWKYGRFEMRAKIPVQAGMWPAFWSLGMDGKWPANGEIDIMEYYAGKLLANACWRSAKPDTAWDSVALPLSDFKEGNWAEQFHLWRMDWDQDWIKLYVDGRLLNEISVKQSISDPNQKILPFGQAHYLLLNLAVGGINGGAYQPSDLPVQFVVDFVRVYQKKK